MMPYVQEEEVAPDCIVFRYRKVRRVKDERRRRERTREEGMRWAVRMRGSGVRMEDSGRVDDEGRLALQRVDLMEKFLENVHRQI